MPANIQSNFTWDVGAEIKVAHNADEVTVVSRGYTDAVSGGGNQHSYLVERDSDHQQFVFLESQLENR